MILELAAVVIAGAEAYNAIQYYRFHRWDKKRAEKRDFDDAQHRQRQDDYVKARIMAEFASAAANRATETALKAGKNVHIVRIHEEEG